MRHPWAPAVIETRAEPGPVMLAHYDAVMGIMRRGGFSLAMTHHALHLLGSRLLGFTRDLFDDSPDLPPEAARPWPSSCAPRCPMWPRWRSGPPTTAVWAVAMQTWSSTSPST